MLSFILLIVGIVVVVVVVEGVGIACSVDGSGVVVVVVVVVACSCRGFVSGMWEQACVELEKVGWEEGWLLGCVEFL